MRLSESLAKRSAVLSAISSIGPTHDPLRPSGPGRHAVAYLKHLDALSERESLREAGRVEVEVLGGDGCRLAADWNEHGTAVPERVRMTDPATYLRVRRYSSPRN
jgi:hypothetical protein